MPMQLDGITLTADDHGADRTHAVDRGSVDVQAIRRHFVFPGVGRVVMNNAASTQPPGELL